MNIKECKEKYRVYSGDDCFIDDIFREKIDYDLNEINKTIKKELKIVDIESYEFKLKIHDVCEKFDINLFENNLSTVKKALKEVIEYDMIGLVEDINNETSLEILEDYTKILKLIWG